MTFAWILLAAGAAAEPPEVDFDAEMNEREEKILSRLESEPGAFGHLMINASFGRALRFNNPFRLDTQLGHTERSVSLTAPYHEMGVAVAFGSPDGLRHGATLRMTFALEGIAQQIFGFGYFASYRPADRWLIYGRLGLGVLTEPDSNVGGQLGLGVVFALTGAVGLDLQLVGDLYYGAATYHADPTVIPIVGAQGGVVVDWEVLP